MAKKPKSYADDFFRAGEKSFLLEAARIKAKRTKLREEEMHARAKARQLRAAARALAQRPPGPKGSVGFRRALAKIQTSWPFYEALAKVRLSVPEWARNQGDLHEETARNWMKPNGGRKIPERWARRIHQEFPQVPVTDEAWPNGIGWGR